MEFTESQKNNLLKFLLKQECKRVSKCCECPKELNAICDTLTVLPTETED